MAEICAADSATPPVCEDESTEPLSATSSDTVTAEAEGGASGTQGGPEAQPEEEMTEARMDELRGQLIHALVRIKGGGLGALGGNPEGPAYVWHSRRRAELMKRPAVKALLRDCSVGTIKELTISISLLLFIVFLHIYTARFLVRFAADASKLSTAGLVILASGTVGAQCAYVIQAVNHELGHGAPQVNLSSALQRRVFYLAVYAVGEIGASLCHIPWTVYYMGGGHMRHHRYVGSARDVDEDALFVLYQPKFPGIFKRGAWLSVGAFLVPVLMFISLIRCAMYDWRSNIKELTLCTLDLACTLTMYYNVGGTGAIYFYLSSMFSMGFLCHPLVGFWILQHLCVNGGQPTASYNGSWLWNRLCFNELLHVEHHDLASVASRHLPRLREVAPELYEPLHAETSILKLIAAWARAGGPDGDPRFSWDFACRTEWGYTRADAQAAASTEASAQAMLKSMIGSGRFRNFPAAAGAGSPSPARARPRQVAAESTRTEQPEAVAPVELASGHTIVLTPPETSIDTKTTGATGDGPNGCKIRTSRMAQVGGRDQSLPNDEDQEM